MVSTTFSLQRFILDRVRTYVDLFNCSYLIL